MPTQSLPITTPIKGVVRAVNREGQPPESCWDAQNVLPYDRYGRKRLAQRGGTLRQFPATTGAFIQGMIEAPNIIYPPNALELPAGSVADLALFPLTTPGTVGPVVHTYPTFSVNLIYEWDFTVSVSGSIVDTGGTYFGGQSFTTTFQFQLDDSTNGWFFLQFFGGYSLGNAAPSGNQVDIATRFYVGTQAGPVTQIVTNLNSPSFIAMGGTAAKVGTTTGKLTIQNGKITFTMAGSTPLSIPTTNTLITQTLWPEMGVFSNNITAITGNTTGSLTVTYTD